MMKPRVTVSPKNASPRPAAQRAHGCKKIAHPTLWNAASDEHEPAGAILIGPCRELDRQMREVLRHLHHHGPATAHDVQQALDPPHVPPPHPNARLPSPRQHLPT